MENDIFANNSKYYNNSLNLLNENSLHENKTSFNIKKDRGRSMDFTNNSKKRKLDNIQKGNYIIGNLIGSGSFSEVREAVHIITKDKVAIKIINKSYFENLTNKNNKEDNITKYLHQDKDVINQDILSIQNEINLLKNLKHKSIIKLYEIMESKKNLYLVMEYCENNDLYDYLVDNNELEETTAKEIFVDIVSAVNYLHRNKIAHRDLKLENILLDCNNKIRITDFGLSKEYELKNMLSTPCGTLAYACPQKILFKSYDGEKSDVWSLGVILFTLICGYLPFTIDLANTNETNYKIIEDSKLNYYTVTISKELEDLISKMLTIDQEERISLNEILNHKWLKDDFCQLRLKYLDYYSIDIDNNNNNKILSNSKIKNTSINLQDISNDVAIKTINVCFANEDDNVKDIKLNDLKEKLKLNKFDPITSVYYLIINSESIEDEDYFKNSILNTLIKPETIRKSNNKLDKSVENIISNNNLIKQFDDELKLKFQMHSENNIKQKSTTNLKLLINYEQNSSFTLEKYSKSYKDLNSLKSWHKLLKILWDNINIDTNCYNTNCYNTSYNTPKTQSKKSKAKFVLDMNNSNSIANNNNNVIASKIKLHDYPVTSRYKDNRLSINSIEYITINKENVIYLEDKLYRNKDLDNKNKYKKNRSNSLNNLNVNFNINKLLNKIELLNKNNLTIDNFNNTINSQTLYSCINCNNHNDNKILQDYLKNNTHIKNINCECSKKLCPNSRLNNVKLHNKNYNDKNKFNNNVNNSTMVKRYFKASNKDLDLIIKKQNAKQIETNSINTNYKTITNNKNIKQFNKTFNNNNLNKNISSKLLNNYNELQKTNIIDLNLVFKFSNINKAILCLEDSVKKMKFNYSKLSTCKYYILKKDLAFTCKIINLKINNLYYYEIKIKSSKSYNMFLHKLLQNIQVNSCKQV